MFGWINHPITYIDQIKNKAMNIYRDQRFIEKDKLPTLEVSILLIIAIFSIYTIGDDRGQIISLV